MTDAEDLRAYAECVRAAFPECAARLMALADRVQRKDECLDAIVQESFDLSRSRHEAIREMDQ